ncbi:IS66 family insertion sequence element accessory protein TnpB [Bradyrhizobium sp. GCM10028915]|uniref:IS66 family insertion sequence element accessory protein TnpB n=1 Tax=Bradyrhizobium sp. GCM10028915 TaxID=3273385 RepID=UPI003609DCAE
MIPLPTGVRMWLATGYTDMRKGFPSTGLAGSEDSASRPAERSPFCFRGRRGDLLKVIWHGGAGHPI